MQSAVLGTRIGRRISLNAAGGSRCGEQKVVKQPCMLQCGSNLNGCCVVAVTEVPVVLLDEKQTSWKCDAFTATATSVMGIDEKGNARWFVQC